MHEIFLIPLWARHLLEVAATAAFTLSGVLAAARSRLDVVGAFAVAFLTAFGGGTLRDLLLDRRPFFWVEHVEYLWGVMLITTLAMLLLRRRHFEPTEHAMQVPDALGLGLFSIVGVETALGSDMPALVAVLMGVVTGSFGGVLRDIVCNEIPTVFRDNRPYALCAFLGGWAYVGLQALGVPEWIPVAVGVCLTAGVRLWALWADKSLPHWMAARW